MPPSPRLKIWLRNARSKGLFTAVLIVAIAALIAWGNTLPR
jgi:hypothetical protein